MDRPIWNSLGLCSGVGLLDFAVSLGAEQLGIDCRPAVLCEWDAYAASVLLARMEDATLEPSPIWCGDLRDFDARPFRGVVDVLAAGLPCQPYSVAGKQQGLSDRRSYGDDGSGPIPQFLRIVAECRPALVFLENVPPWVRDGFFKPVGEELSRMGYKIEDPLFITAEAVGASHKRERVFVLAHALRSDWKPRTGRKRVFDVREAVGNAIGTRTEPHAERCRSWNSTGESSLFAPGPNADWGAIDAHLWPAIKPGVRCVVDGVAVVVDSFRADQLRCSGNAVVPLQAALAFVELVQWVIASN